MNKASPLMQNININHEKASDRPKLRDSLYNIWLVIFKIIKTMKDQTKEHSDKENEDDITKCSI